MKIGIVTYHRALNYGAVLQCMSLYSALKRLGLDVEVVDYRPEAIEKYRMYFRAKDFSLCKGIIAKLRYLVSCLTLINSRRKTVRKFDEFLDNNIKLSLVVSSVSDAPRNYDVVFFGSDQIWNPAINEGVDQIYLGQMPKGHAKFYTYAVSMGRLDLFQGNVEEEYRKYISSFDGLSVRETTMQTFLKEKLGRDSDVVCDPSLLITKEECDAMAVKPKDEGYVLLFILDGNPDALGFADRIAQQLGKKVIRIGAVQNPFHRYHSEVRAELSPAEFLGYIQYADCIVTNSFHATSFSLIMQKNFYTILRKNNNDRAKTILGVAGLEDRLADAKENIEFKEINYQGVRKRLDRYKESSMKWIQKCLETDK
ncbi:polysaccharide pyruvyl transferase family protein [uncultured Prevotella sp.]|uniref:polysaccharide pyruvyl transferase family protein n=1 Tax=uncultured Prevotella sp. TaxID=159272 RepID=UPI00259ACEF6|nr:polysaccharide pyruvyl transferase family protein [uncultured Prevotella sp.]